MAGEVYTVANDKITFLTDKTFTDRDGKRRSEQEIFDTIFAMIDGAQEYILLDMFLFNDFLGTATSSYRQLSMELTEKLIEKKKQKPEMEIVFITDPINTVYGGDVSEYLQALREAGVTVVLTDLTKLRDSNPVYSAWWRVFGQWWGNTPDGGWLPHVMDTRRGKLTLRTYLILLNFKANHRKLIVADFVFPDGRRGVSVLITSGNPHDGSAAHGNVAIKVDEKLWKDVLASERAVAALSGVKIPFPQIEVDKSDNFSNKQNVSEVQLLTEKAIKDKLLEEIGDLSKGDKLDMTMFYLSDRDIVHALKKAAGRGVKMRFILDPNKDAFGRKKNGVPNRQVARELLRAGRGNIEIRWCDTYGEQCHSKMTILRKSGKETSLVLGSANLTRRNLDNYNLETDVWLSVRGNPDYLKEAREFFDERWQNRNGRNYTVPYETYADESLAKIILYRLMETTGMSSF